jgi:uncharacterized lipoprotein YmbA
MSGTTNNSRRRGRLVLFATLPLMLLALAGCFSLSRDAPEPRHWVLGPNVPTGSGGDTTALRATVVGLRTPRLSDYLASPFVVVREGANEVGFSRFDLWGESLAHAIGRSVATHMGVRDPALRVAFAPWSRETRPEHVIEIQIVHFEGVLPEESEGSHGAAHLLAHWEIFRPGDGVRVAWGTTEVRESGWPVDDMAALISFLEGGLATLAQELVEALDGVEPPGLAEPAGGSP